MLAAIVPARNRNARLRPIQQPVSQQPEPAQTPPATATDRWPTNSASDDSRNPATHILPADATPFPPHPAASANKPLSRSPVSTRTVPGAPAKKSQRIAFDRERQRPLVFASITRTLAGSVPFSSGTLTVPTVPACTSACGNVSGAIQRRIFAISSGVARSYFMDDRTGSKPDHDDLRRRPAARRSAGPRSPPPPECRPAPERKSPPNASSHVLRTQPRAQRRIRPPRSSFTSHRVSRTGIGDPAAGGSIQMESALRAAPAARTGRAPRYPPSRCGSYFAGGSNTASTCGFDASSGRSSCGSSEYTTTRSGLLRRQFDHRAIVLRKRIAAD